jgi:hypothetical protein
MEEAAAAASRQAAFPTPPFAYPAQQQGKPLCFYFPTPRCGHRRLPLLAAPGPSQQRHLLPQPPGVGGGGGVGGRGERGRRWEGGMRASDIDGESGPTATPVPGQSQQRHRLPLLAVLPPGISGGGGVDKICQQKAMLDI